MGLVIVSAYSWLLEVAIQEPVSAFSSYVQNLERIRLLTPVHVDPKHDLAPASR